MKILETAPNITCAVVSILKPYWKRKVLEDQDYALILAKLRELERLCREAYAKGNQDAKGKTD